MEADNSDDDYTPITIAYWGEKRQQQGTMTWGDERGWKSVKIQTSMIKEGCIGCGSLHRTGRNYKPMDKRPTQQQPKDTMINTNTTPSMQDSGFGSEGSGGNNNQSTIYSNMDDETQHHSMGKTCLLSPAPSQSSISYSTPLLSPQPAPAISLENIGSGPTHTHTYDQQKNIPELGSTAWKDWAKKSNEINKHMNIGLGFDSNYTMQLGDKRRSPPLSDIAPLDDDDFWNKINLSMQSNSNSNSSSSSKNNNIDSYNSSYNNKKNNLQQQRRQQKANTIDLLSSSSSPPRQYRFADQNRRRYSSQTNQATQLYPQNYYDTTLIVPPAKIAAPSPSQKTTAMQRRHSSFK